MKNWHNADSQYEGRGIALIFDPTSVWNVLQWHVLISA